MFRQRCRNQAQMRIADGGADARLRRGDAAVSAGHRLRREFDVLHSHGEAPPEALIVGDHEQQFVLASA